MDFKEEDLHQVKDILKLGKPIKHRDMYTVIADEGVIASAVEAMGVDIDTYIKVCKISNLITSGLRLAAAEIIDEQDCDYATAELVSGNHLTAATACAESVNQGKVDITTFRNSEFVEKCLEATDTHIKKLAEKNPPRYNNMESYRQFVTEYVANIKENTTFSFGIPQIDRQYNGGLAWGSMNVLLPNEKTAEPETISETIWTLFNHTRRRWSIPAHRNHVHFGTEAMEGAIADGVDVSALRLVDNLIHYDERDIGVSAVMTAVSLDFLSQENTEVLYAFMKALRDAATKRGVMLYMVFTNIPNSIERGLLTEGADTAATLHDYADSIALKVDRVGSDVYDDVDPMELDSFYNKWAKDINTY